MAEAAALTLNNETHTHTHTYTSLLINSVCHKIQNVKKNIFTCKLIDVKLTFTDHKIFDMHPSIKALQTTAQI